MDQSRQAWQPEALLCTLHWVGITLLLDCWRFLTFVLHTQFCRTLSTLHGNNSSGQSLNERGLDIWKLLEQHDIHFLWPCASETNIFWNQKIIFPMDGSPATVQLHLQICCLCIYVLYLHIAIFSWNIFHQNLNVIFISPPAKAPLTTMLWNP